MSSLGEGHLWHSISQGVREARRLHGLTHVPATDGLSSPGLTPSDEGPEETAEEHIVAHGPDSVRPERQDEEPAPDGRRAAGETARVPGNGTDRGG